MYIREGNHANDTQQKLSEPSGGDPKLGPTNSGLIGLGRVDFVRKLVGNIGKKEEKICDIIYGQSLALSGQ